MRLRDVAVRTTARTVRLVGEVESERQHGRFELYFEFPVAFRDFVSASADPFAVALLVPAMFDAEPLEIAPPISPRLLFNLKEIRSIFHAWHPALERCHIEATAGVEAPKMRTGRAATFFSGGVDSFYTLLKHRRETPLGVTLTHIVFMRGLEKPLEFARGVEASQQRVEAIADAAGVQCIAGESNIRTYFQPDWLCHYCGSGLAATALALANGFDYVCIPSTYSYGDFMPIGSTPLVDERYSTGLLQIVHDGAELSRPEKLRRLVEWEPDLVLRHLRVCALNYGGPYNCGRCWKCVRTMIPLDVLGVLDRATTFPDKSIAQWAALAEDDTLPFVEENLRFARSRRPDHPTTALLEEVVRRRRLRRALRATIENSPMAPLLPLLLQARRTVRTLLRRGSALGPRVS